MKKRDKNQKYMEKKNRESFLPKTKERK